MPTKLSPDTAEAQQGLADYCRTGSPDPATERFAWYRELALNVIREGLESVYPLTVEALEAGDWEALVHRFFAGHACRSPQVWRMPGEFLEYVRDHPDAATEKYSFLEDLLLFEWAEVELFMAPDSSTPEYRPVRDWETDVFVFQPETRLLWPEYPVHLQEPRGLREAGKGRYAVLLFRHPGTGLVRFLDLSPALGRVCHELICRPRPLVSLFHDLDPVQAETLRDQALAFFQYGHSVGLIPGVPA